MSFLIDKEMQDRIAALIDNASIRIISELTNHGNEEGLTAALGSSLAQRSIETEDLRVDFRYRQHNKITEERHSGADGGFLVRVTTPGTTVEKVSLFQAKLLGGDGHVRDLKMPLTDAQRLNKQSKEMLKHTDEPMAIFYTWKNIYVVDARDYSSDKSGLSRNPLSNDHRIITLGTYLGKWLPRCTKGDVRPEIIKKAKHFDGFKHGLTMEVISQRPSISWESDRAEAAWRYKGRS